MDMGGMSGIDNSEVLQRSIQLIQNNSQVIALPFLVKEQSRERGGIYLKA